MGKVTVVEAGIFSFDKRNCGLTCGRPDSQNSPARCDEVSQKKPLGSPAKVKIRHAVVYPF
jgi:hypothetical protein